MGCLVSRIMEAQANRVEDQLEAERRTATNRPALAAPGGQVQRLGGQSVKPRGNQSTGATPVGSPVQYAQGLINGKPRGTQGGTGVGTGFDGLEQIDVVIEEPEEKEYILVYNQRYRCQVVDFWYTTVGYTVTLEPDKLQVLEKGEQLKVTLGPGAGTGTPTPLNISIELRRL